MFYYATASRRCACEHAEITLMVCNRKLSNSTVLIERLLVGVAPASRRRLFDVLLCSCQQAMPLRTRGDNSDGLN